MTQSMRWIPLLVLAFMLSPVDAQPRMYKCKLPNDTYSFQADPCADDLQQQVIAKAKAGALRVISTEKPKLPIAAPTPAVVTPSIPALSTVDHNTTSQPQKVATPASNTISRVKIPTDAVTKALTGARLASLCMLVVAIISIFLLRKNRAVPIDVLTTVSLKWPMSCTKCGTPHRLGFASVSAKKSETISSWTMLFGVHRYQTTSIAFRYPVCSGHALKAQIASLITGAIGIVISLFAGVYFFTMLDGMMVGKWATMHTERKIVQTVYGVLLLAWFTIFTLSHGWSPVRLSRWRISRHGNNTIRLLFSNEQYAKEFARANSKEHGVRGIGRSTWYHAIHWPRMFFYLVAAAFAWLHIASEYA